MFFFKKRNRAAKNAEKEAIIQQLHKERDVLIETASTVIGELKDQSVAEMINKATGAERRNGKHE